VVTDLGLGDVIRAWRMLDANTDDERRAIARLLGFELREVNPAPVVRPKPPVLRPGPAVSDALASPAIVPTVVEDARPIELVPFTDVQVNPVALPARGLPRPATVAPAVLEPLFATGWSRAIAGTLTARSAPAGPLHVDRTIDLLARRLPIRRLPRRNRLVSATEVVVVVDTRCARRSSISSRSMRSAPPSGSTARPRRPDSRATAAPWLPRRAAGSPLA